MIEGYFRLQLGPEEAADDPIGYIGPPPDPWDESYELRCSHIIEWMARWLTLRPNIKVRFLRLEEVSTPDPKLTKYDQIKDSTSRITKTQIP